MNRKELARRLKALGLEDQTDAAGALYGDRSKQYNVSRWLSGARPIPDWVGRVLELLEERAVQDA